VHLRAVDRHAAHRGARVRRRAPAVGAPAGRTRRGHRPARGRAARPGAAAHPRRAGVRARRHRARRAAARVDRGPARRARGRPGDRRGRRRGGARRPARRRVVPRQRPDGGRAIRSHGGRRHHGRHVMREMGDRHGARPGLVATWGPLAGILAVLAVVVGLLVGTDPAAVSSRDDRDGTTTVVGDDEAVIPDGVLPYSLAEAQGRADEIDWGPRCDTDTGMLALPISPNRECMAPYDGPPGGATDTGVTDDKIRVVVYTAMENDPVLDFVYAQINNNDTATQQWETYLGYDEILR